METKHTPGPWFVDPMERGMLWAIGTKGGEYMICTVDEDCQRGTPSWRKDSLVRDANARLIAAAPDLLAFAQGCAELPEHDDGDYGWIVRAAREAIAKATTSAIP